MYPSAKENGAKLIESFGIYYGILRAKHDGPAIVRRKFWTHDILFNIDLWVLSQGTKSGYFSVKIWYSILSFFIQTLEKFLWDPVDFTKYVIFVWYDFFFNWNL